ncbi:hypothetical protein M0C34_04590 [Agarivorans sp. TSD2052]|uniref:hypothetical protein n=1 Tax=Agarivorans sp. TSD2052 TaxID=2937286 RepID=UPI00200ECC78|nr:hypothetical protein [Agarivorans sp. TSD2052]UPW19562.1 hypothetical protein M0C34_04590 [Agarivorans sp. TSD2052]
MSNALDMIGIGITLEASRNNLSKFSTEDLKQKVAEVTALANNIRAQASQTNN